MVDCEACVNYESNMCVECEHYDYFREDYYEEATPELIAKREAEYRKRLEESVIDEEIRMDLPQEFIDIFNRLKKFTAGDNPKFLAVYAGETSLMASNGFSVIELKCVVPNELRGKHILCIENNTVTTSTEGLPIEKINKLWVTANKIEKSKWSTFLLKIGKRYYLKPINQPHIIFDSELWDPITEELGNVDILGYTGERDPVLLVSDKGRAFILPIYSPSN